MVKKIKHTKGKWAINKLDFESIEITSDEQVICSMFSSLEEDDETREEISANAKLITAAPDLLKTNIKMTTVVASCIDILSLYIIPNGISEKTAIEQLIGILDNAEIMKSIRLSNLAIDKAIK